MFMYESSLRRQEIVLEPHLQSAIDQYHVSLGKVGFGFVGREVVQATSAASESHKGSGGAHTASKTDRDKYVSDGSLGHSQSRQIFYRSLRSPTKIKLIKHPQCLEW